MVYGIAELNTSAPNQLHSLAPVGGVNNSDLFGHKLEMIN